MVQTDGLSRKCHLFKHDVSFCFTFNEKCIFCCLLRYSKLKERKNMHPFKYYVFYNALLFLHLKSIHGYFGLPQHNICTHPDKDMNYSTIPLNFQGLLSGILSLLTSKTHQMSNSSHVYIWGGSEIMYICFSSVACRIAFQRSGLFFLYHVLFSPSEIRIMYMYTQNVNSMSWPYLYILSDFVHVYLAFAAQSQCHVLWNCIFHTSLTLDLVLRPNYSFIVHV